MSRKRKEPKSREGNYRRGAAGDVSRFAQDYDHRAGVADHRHRTDQLLFASDGVMTLATDAGLFVIPPNRAAWLPAGVRHGVRMFGNVAMRTLYFRPNMARNLPRSCCIVDVAPLLRELILAVVTMPAFNPRRHAHRRLLEVIVDQLAIAKHLSRALVMPSDARARCVANELLRHPADGRSVEELARSVHVSKRTLERVFKLDTRMSFRAWRLQARMHQAVVLLGAGISVTNVALDVGYSSSSAFIAAFRKTLGVSPTKYLQR